MDEVSLVCEPVPAYFARGFEASECQVIQQALSILERRLGREVIELRPVLSSPAALKDYLRLKLAPLSVEAFGAIWLDSQLRLIAVEEMFCGTLSETSVYPREVVKRALSVNAAAVMLYHNHPSGVTQPSKADEHLTQLLKASLALVEVRVLDHLVVGAGGISSMAEQGLL